MCARSCSGFGQKESLEVYSNIYPLYNPSTELAPPEPTHFIVEYNGTTSEFPVSSWNANLAINVDVTIFKLITIRFIKKTSSSILQLGIAAMVIKMY